MKNQKNKKKPNGIHALGGDRSHSLVPHDDLRKTITADLRELGRVRPNGGIQIEIVGIFK